MSQKTWHIRELLKVSTDYLQKKGIEDPRLNAEALLAHLLDMDRVGLYLNFDQPLTEPELASYRTLIKRRISREPLQYITGTQEFWSLDFAVNPHVLIPRPETEIVVEQAITLATAHFTQETPLHILDIGTGSGALAVSLAKEIPSARIMATDLSEKALLVARRNADRHGVRERITFLQGNLWSCLEVAEHRFHIIASNPPYVASEEYDDLPPEVRSHEPRMALEAREGGMFYLQRIIHGAHGFLEPGGWIVLEMAPWQTQRALHMIQQTERYEPPSRIRDYSRQYRVVSARSVYS